jgi:hypothetical protein
MRLDYQLTRWGLGFDGRHAVGKTRILRKLRSRLRKLDLPITIEGDASGTRYNLTGAMTFARRHIDGLKAGERLVFEGASYDQPKWVVRAVEGEPEAPMVAWLTQYVGKSPYLFSAEGPPGPSDCSAATRNAARAAYGVELPHGADLQKHSPLIDIFYDASRVQRDDFIFYNYGRLNWPNADHVEFIAKPGILGRLRCIGSRPSTHGVSFYTAQAYDRDNILCYGRLKV